MSEENSTSTSETNPTDAKTAPKSQRKAEEKAAAKGAAKTGRVLPKDSPYAQ